MNIFYSTPACYLYSLYKENTTWPVKEDDFYPYAIYAHGFLTGFFTSRPALKDYIRKSNNFLQTVRQMAALARLNDNETIVSLNELERAMAVAQHHDAVSGTERQHVANDYARRLSSGTANCVEIIAKSLSNFGNVLDSKLVYCPLLNISACSDIENVDFMLGAIIYNPLFKPIKAWMRIPTVTNDFVVLDPSQNVVPSQYQPIYNETRAIPGRASKANYNLFFQADLQSLGFKAYALMKTGDKPKASLNKLKANENIVLKNEHIQLSFDSSGNLMQIDNLNTGISTPITQQFCYYKSMNENNSEPKYQSSGAYIFRPQSNDSVCFSVSKFSLQKGDCLDELHQVYNDWISQTIRLYNDGKNVEFEWQIGPIDVKDKIGKEVITKFQSNLNSNSLFYTDSNGREMITRRRNFRPTWNLNQTEFIAGNYYPVNTRIYIKDEQSGVNDLLRQLTILTDRSQGGSSIEDGSIEIMIHRRILNDDALGVAEPLNEPGVDGKGLVVNGIFRLLFNTTQYSAALHRKLAHKVNNKPVVTFFIPESNNLENVNKLASDWQNKLAKDLSLPPNIHLLTLMIDYDNQDENAFILRLEHFYEKTDDPVLSQPVTIDLIKTFGGMLSLLSVQELSLGNQNIRF